jgi:hypothetical protein
MTSNLAWEEDPPGVLGDVTVRSYRTRLPADYAYFEGHFPGYPVLAGAVQLQELVLPCLRRACPGAGPPLQWSAIKFTQRIRPGDGLQVRLRVRAGAPDVEFAILRDGARCTQGRLALVPAAAGGRPP